MKFLFVFAAILVGFFVGVFYGISTVSEGNGLAGSAIVLGNGVMGVIFSLVVAWKGLNRNGSSRHDSKDLLISYNLLS